MSEVSCRAFAPALSALEERGIPFSVLTDELRISPTKLKSADERVTWDQLVAIAARLESIFGDPTILEDIYYKYFQAPRDGMVPAVTKFLMTPRDLYWAGTKWFGPSLFSVIEGTFEELDDGRIRETLVIPDRYADCPQLFRFMRGGLRAVPSIVGLPAAHVEMEISPRKGVYTITPPVQRRGRLAQAIDRIRGRRAIVMIETLAAQQERLSENYMRLGEAHDRITAQADRLEEVNRALVLKNEELETRVRERTSRLEESNRVLATEIEERERAAAELLDSREQLRIAERLASVGTLAAGIAHEINNPIAAILLAAQYATSSRDEPMANEIYERSLIDIEREAKRCGTIVKSVLQFARDEPSAKWSSNISDVANRAILHSRGLALEVGAHLDAYICDEPLYCVMNPLQIGQVFFCLLRNAIESTNEGARVTLTVERRHSKAVVTIEDNGAGISDSTRPRIFDPFYTTRRWNGQMGLGLSVAHGILSEHDSVVEVESKVGVGTRARFELEICEDRDRPPRDE